MISALFLVVAYQNHDEVDRFIAQIRSLPDGDQLALSVCDNSPEGGSHSNDVTWVNRPDNPGYLEGALVALEAHHRRFGTVPDWVFLTNTDLSIESTDLLAVLGQYNATQPVVLAPRVTETEARLDKNPHLLNPRTAKHLGLNAALTATPTLARGFLTASALRDRSGTRTSKPQEPSTAATMYAAYGAIIGFSSAFLDAHPLPRCVPLFSEEFVIAEVARRAGVPVTYEPRIVAYHEAHATTGLLPSRKRAVLISRAFRYIWRYRARAFP